MNRDDVLALLKPAKVEVKAVALPAGGCVYVRRIGMDEKDRWELSIQGKDGKSNLQDWRAKFLAFVLCDEGGKRLFDDADWNMLKGADNAHGGLVFETAWSWNGCDKAELDELKKSSASAGLNGSDSPSA